MEAEETCLIIDFGSQYTQLIARRLRELGVFSRIVSHTEKLEDVKKNNIRAIILSGGPASVSADEAPMPSFKIEESELPILGICYGMQLMAKAYGGSVMSGSSGEYGLETLEASSSSLFGTENFSDKVLMSHGDRVEVVPEGFEVTAKSSNQMLAAIENKSKKHFGLQFHPEVQHTKRGLEIIQNFLHVSGFSFAWKPDHIFDELKRRLEEQYEGGKILCALSGGVDSTVLAVLLKKIFDDKVHCFCVDTGLLRKNEITQLKDLFEEHFHFPVSIIDAKKTFLSALSGVTDPEEKRKIIGKVFVETFNAQRESLSDIFYLAQGTLYPDVIESISAHGGPSSKIKSHHNVGGLPKDLPFELMEPFRLLFKDEVRRLGEFLGIPHDFVWRHPFPGPGLAVRMLGSVTEEVLETLREADWRLQEVLRETGWYEKLWQSFCVHLPLRSVGVMGDARTYENCIAVRCVHSEDGMTAHIPDIPTEVLTKISSRIINEVKGINRVVYDISSKPPSTIEWE